MPPRLSPAYGETALTHIAASPQGGVRGAVVWAIKDYLFLTAAAQQAPGGSWDPWPNGVLLASKGWGTPGTANYVGPTGDPHIVSVAAAQQSNGTLRLCATLPNLSLWSIEQTSAGGDWGHWDGNYSLPSWVQR